MKEKSPLRQKDTRTGAEQERERIIALLEKHYFDPRVNPPSVITWNKNLRYIINLIKKDPLKELQQLAEETGEYKNFDNPLIDEEKDKEKQRVQAYIDLLGIIGK
jgi:hypothetical protein